MMRRSKSKLLTVLAAVLFLLPALRATPTAPSVTRGGTPAQSRANAALAQREVALLAAGETLPSWDFGVFSAADLDSAAGGASRTLHLFGAESAVDPRSRMLHGLPYGALLEEAAERHHVDVLLLASVVEAESGFAAHAVSPCGAVGLMQILPETGHTYGIKDLRDPRANIEVGSRYLRGLLARFRGRPDLALAAYNTGPEVVARYGCVPPYRETRDFVKRVLARYADRQRELETATVSASAPVRAARAVRPFPPLSARRRFSGGLDLGLPAAPNREPVAAR